MRGSTRTRALIVVAATTAAALGVTTLSTGAAGLVGGRRFAARPDQARVGQIPSTMQARSISVCPTGSNSVEVKLVQGAVTKASALATPDARGRWSLVMSLPSNLAVGIYAVTAACYAVTSPTPADPATRSYRSQNFRVVPPSCGPEPTTSTTAPCRPVPSTTPGSPGQPGSPGSNG